MSDRPIRLPKGYALLDAARRIQAHAERRVQSLSAPEMTPSQESTLLPIDIEIEKLKQRRRPPNLVFFPEVKGNLAWTGDLRLCVYFHVEAAFTNAGMIVGGTKAGQLEELKLLNSKLSALLDSIEKLGPGTFRIRLNQLFRGGILADRRKERIALIGELEDHLQAVCEKTVRLIELVESDIGALAPQSHGRPLHIQEEAFVREIGALWQKLTGRKPSFKTDSLFCDFLVAAWQSGFDDCSKDKNFERVLKRMRKGGQNAAN